jgi:putative molybdopterin biosynthesis protein
LAKHDDGDRVSLEEARGALLALATPTDDEEVAVEDALGRITAMPINARLASPHYRAAAMDGVAIASRSTRGATAESPIRLREVAPGEVVGEMPADVCVVVDTGNPLPAWADAVARNEAIRRDGDGFSLAQQVSRGRDVRAIGEDIAAGAPLLPRGHRVRPFDLGAMLATGIARVPVRRCPTVAILATGGEIVEPGTEPAPGQIIEYNSRMLAAAVTEWGGKATYLGRSADDLALLTERVRKAASEYDLTCVIAGSSHGRKDFTLQALADAGGGRLSFRGIGMMPGKPTGLAVVDGKPVLAVPGYPVSAVLSCRELVGPFLAAKLGSLATTSERVRAVVRRDTPSNLGVEEFLRVCLAADGETLVVAPLPRGAGSVTTLVRADALLRIPAASEGIAAGSTVEVELLRPRAEIGRTIVAAGLPHPLGAALEDASRRDGVLVRWAYLGLSALDATSALAAGEAHLAFFGDDAACGVPDARALLDDRLPGWRGFEVKRSGSASLLLALSSRFATSPLGNEVERRLATIDL